MRTIVIGDVHGCFDELNLLVETLTENEYYHPGVDKIVFLGDYIDRGNKSREVIRFIRNMQSNGENVIPLMGNHEDMLIDYLNRSDCSWLYNGYNATLLSYDGYKDDFDSDVEWMKGLPLYHEDDNFVYVHAGIDMRKSMDKQSKDTLLWIRDEFIDSENRYGKKVIFGHTPTLFYNDAKPVVTIGKNIDIDTGCVFGGALTALIINDGKIEGFYQVQKESGINE